MKSDKRLWAFVILVAWSGCSDDEPASAPSDAAADPATDNSSSGMDPKSDCETYDSTFAALQARIFEGHGCTDSKCHGEAKTGDLDLRAEFAYANLTEHEATGSSFRRVEPGVPTESFLFLKLQAATQPDQLPIGVQVGGSPMPVGAPALAEQELEAVRVWIAQGAPEKGSVGDARFLGGSADYVNNLLGVCLPPAVQVDIPPLPPPGPDEGIQIEMPTYVVPAGTEQEICFASYYDITARVPTRFKTETAFHVNGLQLRQDAASHHLVINHSGLGAESIHDPSFGEWSCKSGARDGELCDPLDGSFCGDGLCSSEAQPSNACSGFGPQQSGSALGALAGGLATVLEAQVSLKPLEGVYKEVPLKGILYWNAHAFNLTQTAHAMHARLNLTYTDNLLYREERALAGEFGPNGIAPFTKQDVCRTYTAAQGTKMIRMTSHTHKHGGYFWVTDWTGKKLYESYVYSDPTYLIFEPPIVFDAPDQASRTLTYCATFNNGVAEDGSPDVDLVTRKSRFPSLQNTAQGRLEASTTCKPLACVAGKIGAPCSDSDPSACDSSPGAGDGVCDACAITGGQTTENEMFFMLPDIISPAGASSEAPAPMSGGMAPVVQCGTASCAGTMVMGRPAAPCCPADTTDVCGVNVMGGFCVNQDPGTPDPACAPQSLMGTTLEGCCSVSRTCGVNFEALGFPGLAGCNDPGLFASFTGSAAAPPVTCGDP
jgi:hypothetical protein